MSHQEHGEKKERPELPIERGFPIEQINSIVEKESRAKQWYRPIYTMHKWWARRPGCLFRAIPLYTLLDENTTHNDIDIYEPGENQTIGDNSLDEDDVIEAIHQVDINNPDALWKFYPKDIRIHNKKILDPFAGGGTSLVEASRFGIGSQGVDLNPVAWFVTKKQLEAGQTDVSKLEQAYEELRRKVADEILRYYTTPCPNGDHNADVMYNFWVKKIDCISCNNTVSLFNDYRVAKGRYENEEKYNVLCPECGNITLVDDWQDESECNTCSYQFIPKEGHVSRGGYYSCPQCGQKESITDAIQESGGYDIQLYAIEYYCEHCEKEGEKKSSYKGYKSVEPADIQLYEEAKQEWETRTDLHKYVPDENIPHGHMTTVEGAGNDVFGHGYEKWSDMFNARQLLCLSKLMDGIESIEDENISEFLLLALTDSLRYNTMMTGYHQGRNHIDNLMRTNSFDPPMYPAENNVWGAKHGSGTFSAMFEQVKSGVEYANGPTERYIEHGETKETAKFAQPIGIKSEIYQGDMRSITAENEFDAVITDPPYYDNIIYSDLSNYFYVWQKILLKERYECFQEDSSPQENSIVKNPYLGDTADEFEHEMGEALAVINRVLKKDGVLTFTYHHSDEESWGELLEALCNNDFEVTATYPINSDLNKFIGGEAVSFDIVIVARPTDEQTSISWRQLRIDILNKLDQIQESLEEHRDLSQGDIGVIEMGACFAEYSKHHGEVRRSGEIMTAKEAVNEIYGIIQEGALGEQDIFLDLLRMGAPTYDDLNKLLKKSDASEEELREKSIFRIDGNDFILGDWRDQKRQAYVQKRAEAADSDPSLLDQAHYLRYRYEKGKSTKEHLEEWASDDLEELCEGLAEASGDETYLKMIGVDTSLAEFSSD